MTHHPTGIVHPSVAGRALVSLTLLAGFYVFVLATSMGLLVLLAALPPEEQRVEVGRSGMMFLTRVFEGALLGQGAQIVDLLANPTLTYRFGEHSIRPEELVGSLLLDKTATRELVTWAGRLSAGRPSSPWCAESNIRHTNR